MTTATKDDAATAEDTGQDRPAFDPATMTVTDEFSARLDRIRERTGETPAATVSLYRNDGNNLGQKITQALWEDFDEGTMLAGLQPGRYTFILNATGHKGCAGRRAVMVRTTPHAARPADDDDAPAASPAQTPAPATFAPADMMALFMQIMQGQNQQNAAALAQAQQTNQLLLGKLLDMNNKPREGSILRDLVELDELLDRRASRRDSGDLTEAAAPLLAAMAEGMKKAKTEQDGTPPPAAPPATPPAQQPKAEAKAKADPDARWRALMIRVADTLAAGGRRNGDPATYADVLLDYIEAHGFDPAADILDKTPAGGITAALCAQFPQLRAEFVGEVEQAMREAIAEQDDTPSRKDSQNEPTADQ